jgi:endonuclease III
MVTAKTKGPDKQEICKKVAAAFKKKYPAPPKYPSHPVMETMLYAVCLSNNTPAQAQELLDRVLKGFHDLNEMRVSSIEELEDLIQPATQSDLRAIRMRDVLHHVFELEYKFEYESLKRKTLEQAVKILAKIRSLDWFTRAYVLHNCLGAHVLPIDDQMHAILCWLGLGSPEGGPEQTAEGLRGFIRKADGPEFCHLLRSCSHDPAYKSIVQNYMKIHEQGNWADVPPLERLSALIKGELNRKKPPAKKVAPPPEVKSKTPPKGAAKTPEPKKKSPAGKEAHKPAPKKSAPPPAAKKTAKPKPKSKPAPPPAKKKKAK